jgi:hypothetical protein
LVDRFREIANPLVMNFSKSYPYLPIERKILNRVYWIVLGIISSFIFLLSIVLISLQFILDKDFIRGMISEKINESTNLIVTYDKVETIIFPLPGIQLNQIKVVGAQTTILELKEVRVYWNIYALLLKKFELDSIHLESGEITIIRNQDGTFPAFANLDKEKEKVEEIASETDNSPDGILSLLPQEFSIKNIKVNYFDQRWYRADQIQIQSLEIESNSVDRQIVLDGKYLVNGSKFSVKSDIQFLENQWNLEKTNSHFYLNIDSASLSPYADLLSYFPNAHFNNSKISLSLELNKIESNEIELNLTSFKMHGLESKNQKKINEINLNSKVQLNLDEKNVTVESFQYELNNKAKLSLQSYLSWKDRLEVKSKINSDHLDVDSTIAWVSLFTTMDSSQSIILTDLKKRNLANTKISKSNSTTFEKSDLDNSKNEKIETLNSEIFQAPKNAPAILVEMDLNKIFIAKHYIHKLTGTIQGNREDVEFSNLELFLYDGKILVNGNYKPLENGQNFSLKAEVKSIDMKKLLAGISSENLITGKMNAKVNLNSRINGKDSFAKYINVNSSFTIKKGELLGYANFIRPVAEIGKFINFTHSNDGKSTAFHSINGNISYKNKILRLNQFNMEGVGINAIGSGIYAVDGKVDMKFTASLPGIAGKAFKIPILYKGILGKNIAFIDPVWMASVYVGSVIFAGPAGAVIGGLAGSASSDAVYKATEIVSDSYDTAKSFLFGKSEKKK